MIRYGSIPLHYLPGVNYEYVNKKKHKDKRESLCRILNFRPKPCNINSSRSVVARKCKHDIPIPDKFIACWAVTNLSLGKKGGVPVDVLHTH